MGLMRNVMPVLLIALAVLALNLSGASAASKLDQFRADGVIAERFDGFVELRGSGPGDAASLVRQVNSERRAIYEKRAREQNVPVSAVGTLFAKKIVESAPRGTYFKMQDGSYRRK